MFAEARRRFSEHALKEVERLDRTVAKNRFARALALCAVFVFVAAIALQMGGSASAKDVDSKYVNGILQRLDAGSDEKTALEDAGFRVFKSGDDAYPVWFSDEVMNLSEEVLLVMNEDGRLVYFHLGDGIESVEHSMDMSLEARGWAKLGLTGSIEEMGILRSTYVKEGGDCRWLMVSMQQIDGGTSVTMHIQHA